ncbi:hypothetical protein N7528_008541 [Penicillium herquei]|nr:hypothetical protein N7528_008541 [Penicillium herquei]
MDNNWLLIGFILYLLVLDTNFIVLGLALVVLYAVAILKEIIYRKLLWEGVFTPKNKTVKVEGTNLISRNPNYIIKINLIINPKKELALAGA